MNYKDRCNLSVSPYAWSPSRHRQVGPTGKTDLHPTIGRVLRGWHTKAEQCIPHILWTDMRADEGLTRECLGRGFRWR